MQDTFVRPFRKLLSLAGTLQGAIRDHRQWIRSPRAQALENGFMLLAQVLIYLAALLWLWVGYVVWEGFDKELSGAVLDAPKDVLDTRSALMYVLFGAFAIPLLVFVAGFVGVWVYRVGGSVFDRYLPRFAQPLYFPVALLLAASVAAELQPSLSVFGARAWQQGELVLTSARHPRATEGAIPSGDSATTVVTSEELRRLQSQIKDILQEPGNAPNP